MTFFDINNNNNNNIVNTTHTSIVFRNFDLPFEEVTFNAEGVYTVFRYSYERTPDCQLTRRR